MESLVDIGANIAHDSFDDDRDEVLQRAADAGVSRIVVTGSSDDSRRGLGDLHCLVRNNQEGIRVTKGGAAPLGPPWTTRDPGGYCRSDPPRPGGLPPP